MSRKYLSDREWRELLDAQNGACATPDCGSTGPFHADHSLPHYFDAGAKPDQLLCLDCHKAKTRKDKADIYRAKRLNGEVSSQASRRAERAAKGQRPLLQGRGFQNKKDRPRSADEIRGRN